MTPYILVGGNPEYGGIPFEILASIYQTIRDVTAQNKAVLLFTDVRA
jgi:hypothetical protein